MGNGGSSPVSDDDEMDDAYSGPPSSMIRSKLEQLDEILASQPSPATDDLSSTTGASTVKGESYCEVKIGTSALAQSPGMVSKIALIASQSKRLDRHDVLNRLAMGDDGVQANRVVVPPEFNILT